MQLYNFPYILMVLRLFSWYLFWNSSVRAVCSLAPTRPIDVVSLFILSSILMFVWINNIIKKVVLHAQNHSFKRDVLIFRFCYYFMCEACYIICLNQNYLFLGKYCLTADLNVFDFLWTKNLDFFYILSCCQLFFFFNFFFIVWR